MANTTGTQWYFCRLFVSVYFVWFCCCCCFCFVCFVLPGFFLVYLISIFVDLCMYIFLVSVCFLFSSGVVREKNKVGWVGYSKGVLGGIWEMEGHNQITVYKKVSIKTFF